MWILNLKYIFCEFSLNTSNGQWSKETTTNCFFCVTNQAFGVWIRTRKIFVGGEANSASKTIAFDWDSGMFLPFFECLQLWILNSKCLLVQIKIWFQNRRTKFKRKYTSDVETLAAQYYSQIGIGGMARPMVVGDRLWLFSQTPNGQHQTMVLNTPPVPMQKLHSNVRGFPMPAAPTSSIITSPSAMLETARNNMLARNQPLNYGYSKSPHSPHIKRPYDPLSTRPYMAPYGPLPSNGSAFSGIDPMAINYLENAKFGATYCLPPEHPGTDESMAPTGISELERVFGNADRAHDSKSEQKSANGDDRSTEEHGSSDDSDIDCEHVWVWYRLWTWESHVCVFVCHMCGEYRKTNVRIKIIFFSIYFCKYFLLSWVYIVLFNELLFHNLGG